MREIVILGCGFAGYHAARKLEEGLAGRRKVRLTLISRDPNFLFSPLLPSVASGELEATHLLTPLSDAFSPRTRIVIDTIETIDLKHRRLISSSQEISFDYLLIATGGTRNPAVFQGAADLRGPDHLEDAVAISHLLDELVARRPSPLRFGIIGGSATGVEWAAELATSLAIEHGLSPRGGGLQIDLFEAGPRLLPDHSEEFSALAASYLQELGVQIHHSTSIGSATPQSLTPDGQDPLSYDQVFHCAGRVGVSFQIEGSLTVDPDHRILITDELRARDVPGVFVAGDAATALAGLPQSSNPQIALQQGERAAKNLLADMTGRKKRRFQYEDRGVFLTLGRRNSALELRGVVLEGKAAWLAYRLYYTALMPRAFQKARLMMAWVAGRVAATDPELPALPKE